MKKLFLLNVAIFCLSLLSAQTETKLFTGDTAPSLFSRIDIVNWGMTDAAANYVNYGTTATPAYTEIANNPDKSGIDNTTNALHLTSMKGHNWWPDFLTFTLTNPITINQNNRYLHFYHYRENLNKGFSVNINIDKNWEDADKGTKRFDLNLTTAGKWEDVVVDLKWFIDNNEPLSSICIIMDLNWSSESESLTNYYIDEMCLSNNSMPRGINILPDTQMSLFYGNTPSYNKWVKMIDTQNAANTYSIVDNPFTTQTATLNSTRVLKFEKSASASWWQGPRTVFPGVYRVGLNGSTNYMHVMVNIPTIESGKDYYIVQLNAKDFSGNQIDSGDDNKYWSDDAGKWVDCVLDVTSLGYVQEFTVRFDVRRDANDNLINSPNGIFYMDAVSIDESKDQRTSVIAPTALKSLEQNYLKIYSMNRNIVVEGNEIASIEVYNILGKFLNMVKPIGSKIQLPVRHGGVYLVKTILLNGNVLSSKTLVK